MLLLDYFHQFDEWFVSVFSENWYTSSLICTQTGKLITEIFAVLFVVTLSYETIYWSGIYLGLWEWHAKDIFPEVPVHCAHVYIRVNISRDLAKVRELYHLKRTSYNWLQIRAKEKEILQMPRYIKYHFEFSPEDFVNSEDPDWGCYVDHLRARLCTFINQSTYYDFSVAPEDIFLVNNEYAEVTNEKEYLSKCGIETGNVIDCVLIRRDEKNVKKTK